MRYLILKEATRNEAGQMTMPSYKTLTEAVLMAPMQLSPIQYVRIGTLHNTISKMVDNEVVQIEDEDYNIIKQKMAAYIKDVSTDPNMTMNITIPAFIEFVDYVENMPKKGLEDTSKPKLIT